MIIALAMLGCAESVTMVKDKSFTLEKYRKIAVMDFAGNDTEAGAAFSEALIPILMNAGFEVIERSQLAAILKEKELDMSGVVDDDAIQRIGKVAGISAIVLGNFHMVHKKEQPQQKGGLVRRLISKRQARNNPPTDEIFYQAISVRIVDTATAKVLLSSKIDEEIKDSELNKFYDGFAASLKKNFK